jgi:uncharacterized protein (TIGR01244 family)
MCTPLFLFLFLLGPSIVPAPAKAALNLTNVVRQVEPVEVAHLGTTRNVHRAGDLWFGGQFAPQDIAVFKQQGIQRIITLRGPDEIEWDEEAKVREAGLVFEALPVAGPGGLNEKTLDRLRELLRADAGPTLLHCGSANRVGGAWIPFRVLDEGVPLKQALEEAKVIGLRTPAYGDAAVAYLNARPESVKPGINDPFKDPELDVQNFLDKFEVESRDVYAARHAIVAACGLERGMRVADIGAGTGLYTFLFTEAVGPDGWLFAVDIAPRFLEHIRSLSAERAVANVTGVLCAERSISLPPASVDVAFVCDTYHHFEFPAQTLASIRSALAPGGRLLIVDFERIPGTTREWILGHVRAGKETVRAEIEAAGFVFSREIEVEGLEENYLLEFRTPAKR